MQEILRELLEILRQIGDRHPELYDSEVREQIGNAVMEAFVRNRLNYRIPENLGMRSEDANREVQGAIVKYVLQANSKATELGLTQFHERLSAFQDASVQTSRPGNDYEEFFGHTPPDFYDAQGNVIRQYY